jgi:hypothetical protein
MHCYVHTYKHRHVPSGARLVRARSRARHASAHRRQGHSQFLQVGPLDRRRQRRELGAGRGPARQPCGRAGRLRPTPNARRSAARASHARAGLGRGRRPATPPQPHTNAAWCGPAPGAAAHAQQRSAGTAANAHGGGGGRGVTHSSSKSLHWPSDSGSAVNLVPPMDLPCTARACGPRPPRTDGRTWGRTGRSHSKVATHCTPTHPHARDRHTDACGAAIVP